MMSSVVATLLACFMTVLSKALEKEKTRAILIPLSCLISLGEVTIAIPIKIAIIPKYSGSHNRSLTKK